MEVTGKLVCTPDAKRPFEIQAESISVLGLCDHDYPLQKKRHSFEFMREIPHVRPRANTYYAMFRLRSVLSMAIHTFFQDRGFVYVHTPEITGNDAEGALVNVLQLQLVKMQNMTRISLVNMLNLQYLDNCMLNHSH